MSSATEVAEGEEVAFSGLRGVGLRELASGVDALYLSGGTEVFHHQLTDLEEARSEAQRIDGPVPFELGSAVFGVEPKAFGKYRFSLRHEHAQVGITSSRALPAVRVQIRSEFLHAVGPSAAFLWFEEWGRSAFEWVDWSLARLDLFCDVQGWDLTGDDRERFVCRSRRLSTHEENGTLTGFEFGRRKTGTVTARIYDKTRQVTEKGLDWWPDVWGDRHDASCPVWRVEFEINRQGLREFGVRSPTEGLDRSARLWAALTEDWLTFRVNTGDATRSRWPIAPEWTAIQEATVRGGALGLARVRARRRRGSLRVITPSLVGYFARMAHLVATPDLASALGALRAVVTDDEVIRGIPFSERVRALADEEAFG